MQKGNTIIIGIVLVTLAVFGVGYFLLNSNSSSSPSKTVPRREGNEQNVQTKDVTQVSGYTGQVLAGSSSPYLAFTKADYEKALAEGKIVFLDFYANWCPICRGEAPDIEAGFNQLTTDQIVGFRVNYKDSETDADEKALAEQFDIPYQHTKVILRNGQEITRSGEVWDTEQFLENINAL
ncbi:thioredoxin family protein [Candidatus Roizmanbacteria bacterium]|nr:thioredoxin family protein [Candidatus Roizmanbacteria bacterium]